MINMETHGLTVIIPVYNTEKYLYRCLESVTNQSEQSIDIIIINDGSTDDSDRIIKSFAAKYSNIYYIKNDSNIGVGNSRNIGIKNAKTKYIGFIDSDDWVDITYYHEMLKKIVTNNAEMCISGIKTEVNDACNWKYRYKYPSDITVDSHFCLQSLTSRYNTDIAISPIVNNKIYKKSMLIDNSIYFDNSRRAQDIYFSFMVFIFANKVAIDKNVFYHYYQREFSATHNFSVSYVDDYSYILLSLKNELTDRGLYTTYEEEYFSYTNLHLKKLINNMFNNVHSVAEQKKHLIYILKKFSSIISLDGIIDYIDIERLKDFWCF